MKKNILFVIDSLGIGGAEKAVLAQAEEFHKMGHTVSLISIFNDIKLEVPTYINLKILNFKKFKFFKYQRNKYKLFQIIKEFNLNFSLILVHLDNSTRLMRDYKHKNIYHIIHNTISIQALKDKKTNTKRKKISKIKQLYKNLNLITVSKGVENDIVNNLKLPIKSIRTIYNAVDKENILNLSLKKNIIETKDYIVHVGRFHKQKRHDLLLKAFKKANLNTHLVLVGDGPEKTNIENLIKELELTSKVTTTGFIINPYPIIKDAKLLVLTSDFEGFGIVLLESLYLNTPIIATDCPSGPNEILIDEYSKYLMPLNDINNIALKLQSTYKTPYEIKSTLVDNFNISKITKQYIELSS